MDSNASEGWKGLLHHAILIHMMHQLSGVQPMNGWGERSPNRADGAWTSGIMLLLLDAAILPYDSIVIGHKQLTKPANTACELTLLFSSATNTVTIACYQVALTYIKMKIIKKSEFYGRTVSAGPLYHLLFESYSRRTHILAWPSDRASINAPVTC